MKARRVAHLGLLATITAALVLLLTLSTVAQAPEWGQHEIRGEPASQSVHRGDVIDHRFSPDPVSTGREEMVSVNASAIDLGEPGLGFRYVETFGETKMPYSDDPAHPNGPGGLGTDGMHFWVAECDGRRAVKYCSAETLVTQIGSAGLRDTTGTTLSCQVWVGG